MIYRNRKSKAIKNKKSSILLKLQDSNIHNPNLEILPQEPTMIPTQDN